MESVPKKRVARKGATKAAVTVSSRQTRHNQAPVRKSSTKKSATKTSVSPESAPSVFTKKKEVSSVSRKEKTEARKRPAKNVSQKESEFVPERRGATSATETVSLVTGTPSLRLREKLALYEAWYKDDSQRYVQPVAQAFGYLFIGAGFLLAYIISSPNNLEHLRLLATVPCAQDAYCETADSPENTTADASAESDPSISFPDPLLITPGKDSVLTYTIENSEISAVFLKSYTNGQTVPVSISSSPLRLPTANLAAGEYHVYVRVRSDTKTAEFLGPSFVIADSRRDTIVVAEDADETVFDGKNEEASHSLPESLLEQAPGSSSIAINSSYKIHEVMPALTVSLNAGFADNQYRLTVVPTYQYSEVKVFARSTEATFPYFLGTATEDARGWFFWFTGDSLPVGTYDLVIEGYDDGAVKDSAEIEFKNQRAEEIISLDRTASFTPEQSESILAEMSSHESYRPEMDPREPLLEKVLSARPPRSYPELVAREIILARSADFEILFRSYGSFVQTENEVLQSALLNTLEREIENSLSAALQAGEFSGSILSLETALREDSTFMIETMASLEEDRRQISNDASRHDSDADGVPDLYEVLLFMSDPALPDTDRDGVLDGVELANLYNPLTATPQAIKRLPEHVNVSMPGWRPVAITSISPLLVYDYDSTEPKVHLEVQGVSVPHSFVTISLANDSLVASAHTAADGSFSFTLEDTLADGPHSFYATLRDNAGKLLVASAAYTFVKDGTTVSTSAAESSVGEPAVSDTPNPVLAPYTLVSALAVVSFGLVLLLLAQSIRREKITAVTAP